ncbi:MAG TPA: hypothetical protein EYP30_02025 [Archaeoglobaceae archaeon]|nr:hypothetical protein [Archaeoglobaceae archaeon]
MSIYLVRLGRLNYKGKLEVNVGSFVTPDFEEAKKVASFFEKMDYFTEIYEEVKIKETEVKVENLNV